MPDDDLVDALEAAELIGVAVNTMQNARNIATLPDPVPGPKGRRLRWRRGDVEATAAKRRADGWRPPRRHGLTTHPAHSAWLAMRSRCDPNGKNPKFKRYRERGIRVCSEWDDPIVFVAWAEANNYRRGLVIDRVDNGGDYGPDNCRVTSYVENNRNASYSRVWVVNGRAYPSTYSAAEALNVSPGTVHEWCGRSSNNGCPVPPRAGCFTVPVYSPDGRKTTAADVEADPKWYSMLHGAAVERPWPLPPGVAKVLAARAARLASPARVIGARNEKRPPTLARRDQRGGRNPQADEGRGRHCNRVDMEPRRGRVSHAADASAAP